MYMDGLKKQVILGIFWKTLERGGLQGIGFLVSMILARLLGPSEFGIVALLAIFLAVADALVKSGFGTALVQKKVCDNIDFSTIFYFQLAVSFAMYGLLWVMAPWISDFYSQPILTPVLRWAALMIIINGINNVQNAVLEREMRFDVSFYISMSGTISYGVIGISMAYLGYGLWALVVGQLGSALIATLVRWYLIQWRPVLLFSWARLKKLFAFSSNLLFSGLLDAFFSQIYGLIIGRWYSPTELAYYNRGDSLPSTVMSAVQSSIGSVTFPALSRVQDDLVRQKQIVRRVMLTASFFIFPAMVGLAVVAEPLIRVLLTDKWVPAVPFLQLACIAYALWPIHVANLHVVNACGRSDLFLKLEVIKKIMVVLSIMLTVKWGVLALAVGRIGVGLLSMVVNAYPCGFLIGYSVQHQMRDLLPNVGISLLMGASVWGLRYFAFADSVLLIVQIGMGFLVFIFGSYFFRVETFVYLVDAIKVRFLLRGQKA